ncbi:hypothetical protein MJT46_018309 [Ovis ammon polii x Ovis aries]|nr:hypothetical protein MJT46_018309 [Ovis ammon polii x Ovis aries]
MQSLVENGTEEAEKDPHNLTTLSRHLPREADEQCRDKTSAHFKSGFLALCVCGGLQRDTELYVITRNLADRLAYLRLLLRCRCGDVVSELSGKGKSTARNAATLLLCQRIAEWSVNRPTVSSPWLQRQGMSCSERRLLFLEARSFSLRWLLFLRSTGSRLMFVYFTKHGSPRREEFNRFFFNQVRSYVNEFTEELFN